MPDSVDVQFLLVEDDEIDRRAVKRALAKRRINNPVIEALDGEEALEILRGGNGREPLRQPYLILLDLSLPRMGGLEFLREIRSDPELRGSVVFVLTTSDAPNDKTDSYNQFVAGYLVKSDHAANELLDLVTLLEHYILTVELPGPPPTIP